jgi:hypothetical protein
MNYLKLQLFIQPYKDKNSHAIAAGYDYSIVLLILSNVEFKRVKKADWSTSNKLYG